MPGAFDEGPEGNDLGHTFEIRTLLGTGYRFDNGSSISASGFHISNAGLGDTNPGADGILIRYHFRVLSAVVNHNAEIVWLPGSIILIKLNA